jgi:glycosyltransferase 2 family protein
MTTMKNIKKIFFTCLKYLIAVAALIWVFHDIHGKSLLNDIGNIDWKWAAIAVFFDILSYICQGIRWEYLLRNIGKLSWVKTTQAIYAGLFTNEIFPMRFGEFVRAYLVTKWLSMDFISAVPSMAVERLFDGIWLALAIGLVSLFVPLPGNMMRAADIFGIIVIVLTVIFIAIIFWKEKTIEKTATGHTMIWKPLNSVIMSAGKIIAGIKNIGLSNYFYVSLFFSFMILVMQAIAFWLVMVSYGIHLSFWIGAVVLLIVHFGTAIPNAPSNLGTYQFFTVLGLSLFGVDKTTAAGFSLVVFVILTVPLWIIGLLAINRTGLTLKSIREDINILLKKNRAENPSIGRS